MDHCELKIFSNNNNSEPIQILYTMPLLTWNVYFIFGASPATQFTQIVALHTVRVHILTAPIKSLIFANLQKISVRIEFDRFASFTAVFRVV